MSANADTNTTPNPAPEPVSVTLEVPGRIARDYQMLADAGVWLSLEDALQHAVIQSWRFERASYHAVRIDLAKEDEEDETTDEVRPADPAAEG